MSLINTPSIIKKDDWLSAIEFSKKTRQALQQLAHLRLGVDSAPTFESVILNGLTANRLVQTDSETALVSVTDFTNWVAGTANEIDITDDGDGTITIGIVNPLIVSKGGTGAASLTDHSLLAGSGTGAITALAAATNGQLPIGSTGADPVIAALTGTANQLTVTNGAGSITLSLPQDIHTGASPTFTGLTLSGITLGSVLFAGTSGVVSQDNSNLFWDDTNNRLGVGINSGFDPRVGITVLGDIDILHTATLSDDHAFELDINAAGFGDVKAIDIVYVSGDIGAGEDEEAILVNVDESDSGPGDIAALEVLATDVGSAKIFGLEVGINVIPIEQLSGTFGNMAKAENDGVNALTEFITSDPGDTNNIEIFVGNGDTVLIGNTAKFEEIEFIFETFSNPSIKPTFEFSTGGTGFSPFTPADGTNGMRNNGVVLWLDSDIPSWATNTGGNYEIRITRTRANLAATPKEDFIQIGTATEYVWNKDGDVNINSLTLDAKPSVISSAYAIQIKPSDDADNYLEFYTSGNLSKIKIIGGASLHVESDHATGIQLFVLEDGSNFMGLTWDKSNDVGSIYSTAALNLQSNGDLNDYIQLTTVGDVPTIGTIGDCDLKITSDGGNIDFDDENLLFDTWKSADASKSIIWASAGVGSLILDGDVDYVVISGYAGVTGAGHRTIAMWVKTDAAGGHCFGYGAAAMVRLVCTGTGKLRVKTEDGNVDSTSTILANGSWHLIAMTYDGTNTKAHFDGNWAETSAAQTLNTTAATTIKIGINEILGTDWDGEISDVMFFDDDLTQAEYEALFALGRNPAAITAGAGSAKLVSWWPFTANAEDAESSNDGTFVGDAYVSSTQVAGLNTASPVFVGTLFVSDVKAGGFVDAESYKVGAVAGIDYDGIISTLTVVKGIVTAAS